MNILLTLPSAKNIAFDGLLFTSVFDQDPDLGALARSILEKIEEGTYQGITSVVSLTKILERPVREGNVSLEKQYKLLFSHFPNLKILDVSFPVAERAAALQTKYRIPVIDALHIATAIEGKADIFITGDPKLAGITEIPCFTIGQSNQKSLDNNSSN